MTAESLPTLSLDRVLSAAAAAGLKVVRRGQYDYQLSCPVHEDKTPSLSVSWKVGPKGGTTVLHCHGCQAPAGDIAGALGLAMTDLFDEPPQRTHDPRDLVGRHARARQAGKRRGRRGPLPRRITSENSAVPDGQAPPWTAVETYAYVTVDGELVLEVTRQERTWPDGRRDKNFPQRFHHDGQTSSTKPAGFSPVLYRHPQVVAAIAAGQPVWLCEGEKDVHTAERLGLVATTNAQGSGGFPAELAPVFAGAEVSVVLDRDPAGFARGVAVHEALSGIASSVRLLLPAPRQPKADLTDHVEAGHGVEDLVEVGVGDAAAWAALGPVRDARRQVMVAMDEALAQADLAERAATTREREQHERNAGRWALETEVRLERMQPKVEVALHRAAEAGSRWAAQAGQQASDIYDEAVGAARAAHERARQPLPPMLATTMAVPSPASGPEHSAGTVTEMAGGPGVRVHPRPLGAEFAVFRLVDGCICEVTRPKGDGDEKLKMMLALDVRIKRYYVHETDADLSTLEAGAQPPTDVRPLVSVLLGATDPTSGEAMEWTVPAEDWNSGAWLNNLPGRPSFDRRKSGRERLTQAVNYISEGAEEIPVHRTTGWRSDDTFVAANGVISDGGLLSGPVSMTGALARYQMPTPTTDPEVLREAFATASGWRWLDVLPPRVAAPLLGHVYRSVLTQIPTPLVMYGLASTYKTSLACLAMHHLGPNWERNSASSMDKTGDTTNARRILMNRAKDVEFWLDDVNPDHGVDAALEALDNIVRSTYNRLGRHRSNRTGEEVSDATPVRCSALITSEMPPTQGSARERAMLVPMVRGQVSLPTVKELDEEDSRRARATLMASMLAWMAGRREELTKQILREEGFYADALYAEGIHERAAEGLSYLWGGWTLMLRFLTDVGAITEDERDATLQRVRGHLMEAYQATQRPDLPSNRGEQLLESLRQALAGRLAHVLDVRTGQEPPAPLDSRLGWERQHTGMETSDGEPKFRLTAKGRLLGYVMHDPGPRDAGPELWLYSQQMEILLKEVAAKQVGSDALAIETILDHLHAIGAIEVDVKPNGSVVHKVKRTVHCQGKSRQRFVVIPLGLILNDTDDPDIDGDGDAPGGDALGAAAARPAGGLPDATSHGNAGTAGSAAPRPARADAEGTLVAPVMIVGDTRPCLACSRGACYTFDGQPMHLPCWEQSTHATRQAMLAAPTAAAPASVDTVDGAGTSTARQGSGPPPSTPGPSRIARAVASDFTAAVAVAHTDGVWLPDGSRHPLPAPLEHVGHLADLAHTLHLGTQVTRRWSETGQVWVTADLAARLGIDTTTLAETPSHKAAEVTEKSTRDHPVVTAALQDGWHVGGGGRGLRAFTRVWSGDQAAPWVVLIPAIVGSDGDLPILVDQPAPAELARRLQMFADALGHPWKISPATTGIDLLTSLRFTDKARLLDAHHAGPAGHEPRGRTRPVLVTHPHQQRSPAAVRALL